MRAELIVIVADSESQLKALRIPELVLPASTEVLESAFGSFKAIQRTHSRGTFTSQLATFPTLFDQCTPEKIRERFQRVRCRELKEWITAAGHSDSTQNRRTRSARESWQRQANIQFYTVSPSQRRPPRSLPVRRQNSRELQSHWAEAPAAIRTVTGELTSPARIFRFFA
jgi:hypothetical protein